jgi:recombinational DNA repair protein (RecF pathway)
VQLARGRGTLAHVRQVDLAHPTHALRDNWRRQQAAASALDTLGRMFEEGQASPAAFHLTVRLLDLLDDAGSLGGTAAASAGAAGTEGGEAACAMPAPDEEHRLASLLVAYTLKLLHVYGASPSLSTCVRCGRDEPETLTSWSAPDGGVVCETCRGEGDAAIGPGTRTVAVWLLRSSLAEVAAAEELPPARDLRGVAQRVVGSLCEQHAGFVPKLPGSR